MSTEFASITKFWETPNKNFTENGESWVYFDPIWVSDKGRACNPSGIIINCNAQQKWTFKHTPYSRNKTMAQAFKIQNYELLETKGYVVSLKDKTMPCHIDNLVVNKRGEKMNETLSKAKEEIVFNETSYVKLIPMCKQYAINKNGFVFNIRNPSRSLSYQNNGKNCFRYRDEEDNQHIKLIDILMCMIFKPFENLQTYQEYLTQCSIVHINGNLLDDRLSNLEVKWKDLSQEKQRKINVEERKEALRTKVLNWLQERKATLETCLEDIESVFNTIIFICNCQTKFSRIIKDCFESQRCQTCLSKQIKDDSIDSEKDFTLNGEEFIKIEGGWVSRQGNFLNSFRKPINILKGYVQLLGKKCNAKVIIAKTFKLQNYQLLSKYETETDESNEDCYQVFQKDKTKGFEIENLEVSTSKLFQTGKKPKFASKEHLVSENEVKNIDSIIWERNPNYIFFKNGVFYNKRSNNYSKGNLNKNGYRTVRIGEKMYFVHRIICFLFNPLPDRKSFEEYNDFEVDHINNKKENYASNLRWVTSKENKKFGVENNAYKSNKAINVYKLKTDSEKGDLLNAYKTMKETLENCEIGKKKLSELIKNGGGIWKGYYYEQNIS